MPSGRSLPSCLAINLRLTGSARYVRQRARTCCLPHHLNGVGTQDKGSIAVSPAHSGLSYLQPRRGSGLKSNIPPPAHRPYRTTSRHLPPRSTHITCVGHGCRRRSASGRRSNSSSCLGAHPTTVRRCCAGHRNPPRGNGQSPPSAAATAGQARQRSQSTPLSIPAKKTTRLGQRPYRHQFTRSPYCMTCSFCPGCRFKARQIDLGMTTWNFGETATVSMATLS